MSPAEAQARADADAEFTALLAGLPEAWAKLDASDDGTELTAAYLRAAYGAGYVKALQEGDRS